MRTFRTVAPARRFLAHAVVACLAVPRPGLAVEGADPGEQAVMLHARGVGRELEGKHEEALDLLRQAAALAPTDEDINFDLARLSYERRDPRLWDDARGFLALTPSTEDGRVLRAYLLRARGDAGAALAELRGSRGTEALQLQRILQRQNSTPTPPAQTPRDLGVRAAVSGEYDSNVQVLPDPLVPVTNGGGARLNADVAGQWQPLHGDTEVHVTATLRTGTHVNNRANLALYDTESTALLVGGQTQVDKWLLYADIEGSLVFVHDFRQTFMRQALGDALAVYDFGGLRAGVYGLGGPRHFYKFGAPVPPEYDRDGALWEGGATFDVFTERLLVTARAGWQGEHTAGPELREHGFSGLLTGRYAVGDATVSAMLAYQHRGYGQSTTGRVDDRFIPGARLAYRLAPGLQAVASYTYIDNRSVEAFQYKRHLANVGVEATW
jgi:hypothetical protein